MPHLSSDVHCQLGGVSTDWLAKMLWTNHVTGQPTGTRGLQTKAWKAVSAGQVVLAVLSEAKQKFGDQYASSNPEVIAFVRRRVHEILTGQRRLTSEFQPRDFDAKARQANEDK